MNGFFEVENLSAGYGNNTVLKEINLAVEKGAFVGIIGPNGAGKSTLLKTASGVLKPYSGQVRIQGEDLYRMPPRLRARQLAFVPQDTIINFSFSVMEIVLMGRYPYWKRFRAEGPGDIEVVRRCLEFTDARHLIDREIDSLSAGERQGVVIARALAQEPELLLLDEAAAHLDIGHQIEIFDLLKKLNREKNLTIISVLHNLNLAAEYCHRLVLLNEGRVVTRGRPAEVLTARIIGEIYQTRVRVEKNPVTGKPYVISLPGGSS